MIQRIQSLYFLLAILFQVLFFTGPVASFTSDFPVEYRMEVKGLFVVTDEGLLRHEGSIPLYVLAGLVIPLLLLGLLSYKKRKLQMRIAIFALLLLLGLSALTIYYLLYFRGKFSIQPVYEFRIVLPVVSAILTYLGYRGVLKDELLISSYDRLR